MAKQAKSKFSYDYPRPALAVDAIVTTAEANPRVLLIRRAKEPFAGTWALPGGFVEEGETLLQAMRRELREETSLELDDLRQFLTAGDPGRDPRGWTVSVVYLGQVTAKEAKKVKAGDDAGDAKWFKLDELPPTAFDHAAILGEAVKAMG